MTTNLLYVNGWNTFHFEIGMNNINLGDDLNYLFLPKIMPYKIIPYRNNGKLIKPSYSDIINYSFIGSVIDHFFTNKNTIIWGSGIRSDSINLEKMENPRSIYAVRGPLTRKKLIENGFDCPEIYGDPALLLPLYYNPKINKKYKIGIIKHWQTKADVSRFSSKDIHVISISNYKKWTKVIDDILSCDNIVSESLHGLIIAEAYNIPNLWVDIELEKLESSKFKFNDFFQSLGKDRESAYTLTSETTAEQLFAELSNYKRVFNIDLIKLINSCPVKIILNKNKHKI